MAASSAPPSFPRPKVSVIIATYNYSSVLRYAIETVLWQSFQDFELIVAGDCCTDDSEQVVKSFRDPRVRWLNLPENSGSKGLPQNAAVQMAQADLIAYLAHDDLWRPSHLATVVDGFENCGADFVYTVAMVVPPPGETRREIFGIFPDGFRGDLAFVHSSVLHRKSVFEQIGPWPDYRTTQLPADQTFWDSALAAGLRFQGIPKVTVWKFNASSRPGSYLTQRCDEQARYFTLLRDNPAFAEEELIEVIQSAMVHGIEPVRAFKVGHDAPPGAYTQLLRQIRGLDPLEPMMPIALEPDEEPFRVQIAAGLPSLVRARERFEVEVRIENGSAFTLASQKPHPVHFSYHWLNEDDSVALWDGERSQLVPPLPAGSSLHYVVAIKAPDAPGVYRLQPALVQEGMRWWDSAGRNSPSAIRVLAQEPLCVSSLEPDETAR